MPRLRPDLEARFIRRDAKGDGVHTRLVKTLKRAEGVMFLCPKCFKENGGARGTHMVMCWFVGVPQHPGLTGPGRWTPSGTGLKDLTFVPGNPPQACSVQLTGSGCN